MLGVESLAVTVELVSRGDRYLVPPTCVSAPGLRFDTVVVAVVAAACAVAAVVAVVAVAAR